MNAIWLVRSRELASRLRFWTAIVGYDPRDHSLIHRIYLVYLIIFFSLWGFSVLTLLADVGIWVLSFFKGLPPAIATTIIMVVALLLDAVLRGYKSCRRSPFVFSEEDAGLICQTPVDRRQVAFVWLLGDWPLACLPFVVLAVVLRFSSLQLAEQGPFLWSYLPRYWLAAFIVTSIVLPLHLSFMAGGFALGSLRLHRARDFPALSWIPVGFVLVTVSLAYINIGFLESLFSPLVFPLKAGYGLENWLVGFILAVFLALVGLVALYFASPRLNLSRAAQESGSRWANQQVSILGDSRLMRQMKLRGRLGIHHSPSRIPGREGAWSLVWKDIVISYRAINFSLALVWLGIFGLSLGIVIAPDWGTRFWGFIIWCYFVGQRCTDRLRSDLELWIVSRQLPFSWNVALAADLAVSTIFATLLFWLAILIGSVLGFSPQIYLILLAPVSILSIELAASFDLLRKCHSSELLAGQVADPGATGLLLGAIFAGIPLLLIPWLSGHITSALANTFITLLAFTFSLWLASILLKKAAYTLNGIK
jgi:hypothetical protein